MRAKLTYLFLVFFIFMSCSKEEVIYEPTKKINPFISYEEGLKAFKENDFFFASKKFSEAELNFDKPEFENPKHVKDSEVQTKRSRS